VRCALLAERHRGLSHGVRGLLEPLFEVIVMVADETSLTEAVARMGAAVAVVDLSLSPGPWSAGGLVARLRRRFPDLRLVAIGFDDDGAGRTALAAGADAFVAKCNLATDLVPAIDAVLAARGAGGGEAGPGTPPAPGKRDG
jgi:DNA-binding NarL/FixJ family response regulator